MAVGELAQCLHIFINDDDRTTSSNTGNSANGNVLVLELNGLKTGVSV